MPGPNGTTAESPAGPVDVRKSGIDQTEACLRRGEIAQRPPVGAEGKLAFSRAVERGDVMHQGPAIASLGQCRTDLRA